MEPAKILVVEDEVLLRQLYADTLTEEGYRVETAADGEEALKKMQAGGWDLVLLDIILPKIDGIGLMKIVKGAHPARPNKCVVFLTNVDKDEKIKEALKFGDGYLIKSQITPGDLIKEVRVYLKRNIPAS
ncbi:response regulator [Candidatus Microgenomates bacterium]|nr:response regulator [Candidatus Microgenomates bacterium]